MKEKNEKKKNEKNAEKNTKMKISAKKNQKV